MIVRCYISRRFYLRCQYSKIIILKLFRQWLQSKYTLTKTLNPGLPLLQRPGLDTHKSTLFATYFDMHEDELDVTDRDEAGVDAALAELARRGAQRYERLLADQLRAEAMASRGAMSTRGELMAELTRDELDQTTRDVNAHLLRKHAGSVPHPRLAGQADIVDDYYFSLYKQTPKP